MKLVSLLSSGIDSPVATHLISKITNHMIIVHVDNDPYVNKQDLEYFLLIVKHLKKIHSIPYRVYILPNGENLTTYKKSGNPHYTCVFCKRMLIRYAERIAEKERAKAIVMGDSLGQVASQTLQNIRVVDQVASLPILRPLIGLDKVNIVRIAEELSTYTLSIRPSYSCTAAPVKPSTKTPLEKLLHNEASINIENMVDSSLSQADMFTL